MAEKIKHFRTDEEIAFELCAAIVEKFAASEGESVDHSYGIGILRDLGLDAALDEAQLETFLSHVWVDVQVRRLKQQAA